MTSTNTVADQSDPVGDVWISRAEDGDVMVIMGGANLAPNVPVGLDLVEAAGDGPGRLHARQDGRLVVDAALDQLGHDMVAEAPSVVMLEVYKGATSDQDRYVLHESVTVGKV